MAKTLHWAPDMADESRTSCGEPVGYLLAETGDDVTAEDKAAFRCEAKACRDCIDALDEED